jgi:cation diffusion facilitator family transporter
MKKNIQNSWMHALIGIGVNLSHFIIKVFTGLTIQSIAFVNDGFNHLSDTGTSLVMLVGFLYGDRSADDNHPHGHGRAEYVATLVIGMLIIVLAGQLFLNALSGLMSTDELIVQPWVYVVVGISMMIKFLMYVYYTRLHHLTHSLPYKAVAIDAINDVLITGFVGLGTYFSSTTWRWDAIAGLLIAGFIFVQGFRVVYEAFQTLIGKQADDSMLTKIGQALRTFTGVVNIHALSFHDYGPLHRVVTVHVELPYTLSLTESHTLVDRLEILLEQQFPIELIIHVDPITQEDAHIRGPYNDMTKIISSLFPHVTLEAFRMVNTPDRPEVIFKIIGLQGDERTIYRQKNTIKQTIQKYQHTYRVFVE